MHAHPTAELHQPAQSSLDVATMWKVVVLDPQEPLFKMAQDSFDDLIVSGLSVHATHAPDVENALNLLAADGAPACYVINANNLPKNAALEFAQSIRLKRGISDTRFIIISDAPVDLDNATLVTLDISDWRVESHLTPALLNLSVKSSLRTYIALHQRQWSKDALHTAFNAMGGTLQQSEVIKLGSALLTQLAISYGFSDTAVLCARRGGGMDASVSGDLIIAANGPLAQAAGRKLELLWDDTARDATVQCLNTRQGNTTDTYSTFYTAPEERGRDMAFFFASPRKINENMETLLAEFAHNLSRALDNTLRYENGLRAQLGTILALAAVAESKDKETIDHCLRVAQLSESIARDLQKRGKFTETIDDVFVELIGLASMLHDVGKVFTPPEILNKPGALDPDERMIVEEHAAKGSVLLTKISLRIKENRFLLIASEIANYHHEWMDGNGYPNGLSGDIIPVAARIVSIVDVFDALTTIRPYKQPWPVDEAIRHIKGGAGSQFDPDVVDSFLHVMNDGVTPLEREK
jgi:putative nucleotidyltransferase with HDIG domain